MKSLPVFELDRCRTKYPILLVHGTGFRDDNKLYNYWGRIPESLVSRGATVFYSGQDSWGNIEQNALTIQSRIQEIVEARGIGKFNIIAHSKGGLESRYLISKLGMGRFIASVTTISTPHHGSKTIDMFYDFPSFFFKVIAFFINAANRVMGDAHPDFHRACKQMSERECWKFNEEIPDEQGILYQSYGTKMKYPFSDLMYFFLNILISAIEGDNDGLVTVESSKWGDFKGIIENRNWRGVSHSDAVDLWRMNLFGFDIRNTYIGIVEEIRKKGF